MPREGGINDEYYAKYDETMKEVMYARTLGDLYVNLLRSSRSHTHAYRAEAADSLIALLKTIALTPVTTPIKAVTDASRRVGWREEPDDKMHQSLSHVAEAAITYMIEASGYSGQRLLTKRTNEFVKAIELFNDGQARRSSQDRV